MASSAKSGAEPTNDRKASINVDEKRWPVEVLKKCPDLSFPAEFFSTHEKVQIAGWTHLNTLTTTPDGKSFKHWVEHPR